MLHRILIASALATLAVAGTASAAQAPTLGPVTVIPAGQKTPVAVAGNHMPHGSTIRKGTELRRWTVTMHGKSNANVALSCGPGGTHIGLALQDHPTIFFGVSKGSNYYHHTIKVHFYPRTGVDANGAHGSVYALCKIPA